MLGQVAVEERVAVEKEGVDERGARGERGGDLEGAWIGVRCFLRLSFCFSLSFSHSALRDSCFNFSSRHADSNCSHASPGRSY